MNYTMVTYVFLTLLGLYSIATRLAPYHGLSEGGCRLGYVYDGDTAELICGENVRTARFVGLDTPETKSPGCRAELDLGKRATERMRALLRSGIVELSDEGFDKYGRALVRVFVDGRDVAKTMVAEGLAVTYQGGTRPDWCAKLER
ncbi:thermonuclease family protein [Actibacterium lipolyticum]|uniref:thermonuclease family protein n=1 Tax=Actibacterium lipolyticum TaxID=1524263 RepID=UPI0011305DB0|nr:thermonuclease family protein [Actibacterium lipolyticum]